MLSKEEADCIYAYNLHQVQIRINRCGEVMERKDYIRMDQEIIRTLGPKIICSACQKFANFFLMRKKPNEHYSFEAEILHFSA